MPNPRNSHLDASSLTCPTCGAQPGQPCTSTYTAAVLESEGLGDEQQTERRSVSWYHYTRESAFRVASRLHNNRRDDPFEPGRRYPSQDDAPHYEADIPDAPVGRTVQLPQTQLQANKRGTGASR